ncbi:MAG: DUF2817 domain-containing protein [Rhodospirillales bacterium]|nr:DUF2817 domain-containing protein [Alphaproteobacteria bacterium]MCB9986615.1 DUF2817 domain-containing protein [Rhodospirillales bacterium]USO06855.1 MAG: DUF2817 domain-containing protein [Rhodospirillales bacterium]
MTKYFHATYFEARHAFVRAAEEAGFKQIFSEEVPFLRGPSEERLSCSVVARRKPGNTNALVTTSGVHGVEGYAGSALQIAWLKNSKSLPDDVDVVHIHALNPFGMAWNQRTDEWNIDVNRNFVDEFPVRGVNPDYAKFRHLIVPKSRGPVWFAKTAAITARYGMRALQNVLTGGQYDFSDGMFYGGDGKSWSRRTMEKIIATHLGGYARIVHLDLHTGLGNHPGANQILYAGAAEDKNYARLRAIWPVEDIAPLGDARSVSSALYGTLPNVWRQVEETRNKDVLAAIFEFATVHRLAAFNALQLAHMARNKIRSVDTRAQRAAQRAMRAAFAPQDPAWEQAVIMNGTRPYQAALRALGPR